MKNTAIPFLCGGTFLTQIIRAMKDGHSANNYLKGQKKSFSEPELFRRLISIYRLSPFEHKGQTLKSYTTEFKKCKKSLTSFIQFNDAEKRAAFNKAIQKDPAQLLSKMAILVTDFIDEEKYDQLTRNLLGLIQEDSTIPQNEKFFICPKWVEKQSLTACTNIDLPSLFLGIWHFIVINRYDKNEQGADTYKSWYPYGTDAYEGNIGTTIEQRLNVTCKNPLFEAASKPKEDKEQNSQKSHEANDSSDTEEKNYSKTQIIQNATIVNQHGETNIHINHVDTLNI